jgi:EmrB/QacA subfamily drug resistance transporter
VNDRGISALAQPSAAMSAATKRRRRIVTAASMLAMIMASVEGTIVATAMPTIVAEIGGFQLFSWVFASYLLTQAVTTPIYGRLSDYYGRRAMFFCGAGLFLIGSTACGFAWGMVPLIIFRIVQGLGAGAIQPLAITIVGDIYEPAERARMQGWLSSIWGIAAVLGPVLGAFIVTFHWQLIFWINIPIGIAAIAMLGSSLEERRERHAARIDYQGAALLMIGLGALMAAAVQATSLGAKPLAALAAVGAAALAVLANHERRIADPIVPFKLWRHRVLAVGNFGGVALGALIIGNGGFLPTYIQGVLGHGPGMAGAVLATSSVAWSATGIMAGRMMARHSYRRIGVIGALFILAGTLFLVTLDPAQGMWQPWVGAFLCGSGLGFCNTMFVVSAQTSVGWSERGVATASNMFMRTAGQSMAAAFYGAILNLGLAESGAAAGGGAVNRLLEPGRRSRLAPETAAKLADAITHALHHVYLTSLLIALATLALTLSLPRGLSAVRAAAAD